MNIRPIGIRKEAHIDVGDLYVGIFYGNPKDCNGGEGKKTDETR